MEISGSVALVTGANRGMGRHFATQLLERGAAKVYATARDPERVDIPGTQVVALDITDPTSVAAAAAAAPDVTLLVNNAGVSLNSNLVTGDPADIRLEMETNFFGTLSMVRAFAPVLAANGGGAILDVLSALSWLSYDGTNGYAAAKAAEWSLTNGVRLELAAQRGPWSPPCMWARWTPTWGPATTGRSPRPPTWSGWPWTVSAPGGWRLSPTTGPR